MIGDRQVQIRVTRRFRASAERVFDAWLDPARAGEWLFATPVGERVRVEIDGRVGGRFHVVERRGGEEAQHLGEYLEIDRPRRLVFTFATEPDSDDVSRVSVEFIRLETGCELTLAHQMSAEWEAYADRTRDGWAGILDGLAAALDAPPRAGSQNTAFVAAAPEAVYRAFTAPVALAAWLAPDGMTGRVHDFDGRAGGGYRMSLYHPPSDTAARGKTAEREDRYTARFVELVPPERIVAAITFDTADPAFMGEMTMEVAITGQARGSTVSILFRDIPPGIRPEDNEAGTRASLAKLARLLESAAGRPPRLP